MSMAAVSSERKWAASHRLAATLLCVALLAAAGCSPAWYKRSADREVYDILEAKAPQVPGNTGAYDIEMEQRDLLAECPVADASDLVPAVEAAGEEAAPEDAGEPVERYVVISLPRALQIATELSRDYQNQKEALYLSALALTLQRYQFDPQFFGTLSGTYNNTDLGDTTQVTGATDFGLSWLFRTGTRLSVSLASSISQFLRGSPERAASSLLSINITQPLLQGAGLAVTESLTQAERDVVYQVRGFIRFRRTFFVRVLSDYYRVLELRQILENERLNYQNLSVLRERAEWLGQAGEQSEYEVDQIRQDELRAENSYVTAQQNYENELDRFKITLGLPTDTKLVLDPGELDRLLTEGVVAVDLPVERTEAVALARRLDLMTRADRVEDALRRVKVAANDLLPGLDLSASASVDNEGDSSVVDFQADRADFTAGFELDLPLDKLSERNTYRRRLIDHARACRDFQELRDQVIRDVREAWRQYLRANRSYEIQQKSVTLAEGRVESTTMLWEAGRRVQARDFLEAQEALVRARNQLASALVDYKVASLELARDMGILAVGDNGELEESFDEYD
jgi:outer membrane protein TolC